MAKYTVTRYRHVTIGGFREVAETVTRKRIDAARFHMERMCYDMHDANGTRDTPQAWIDRAMAKGLTKATTQAGCGHTCGYVQFVRV